MRRRRSYPVPVNDLPAETHKYTDAPRKQNGLEFDDCRRRAYERWCDTNNIEPWPATVETIIRFAAEQAVTRSYNTIVGTVRVVAREQLRLGGADLLSDRELRTILGGIRRVRRPCPLLPASISEFEKIIKFRPPSWTQQRNRTMAMLAFAAGFTRDELRDLRVETISFTDEHAVIINARLRRARIWIGRANDPNRCPVVALEAWLALLHRSTGPAFPPRRKAERSMHYDSIGGAFAFLGKLIGWDGPLTIERLRRGGMIEQSRTVDIVPLARYHGYRTARGVAGFLGIHVEQYRRGRCRSGDGDRG